MRYTYKVREIGKEETKKGTYKGSHIQRTTRRERKTTEVWSKSNDMTNRFAINKK